jgi:predicted transcriptional regulator
MTTTTHRTTFSLDEAAVGRLQLLARRWNVSQAEVIRRSLALAESQPYESTALQALEAFHEKGGLAAETAATYLGQVAASRDDWGRE